MKGLLYCIKIAFQKDMRYNKKYGEKKMSTGGLKMTKDNEKYQAYVQILNEELIPAMGCTEPIALVMRLQRQEKYWDVCRTESVSEQAEVSLRM